MKKKIILFLLAMSVTSAMLVTSCGKTAGDTDTDSTTESTEETTEDSTDTDSDTGEADTTDVANPMVAVDSADDFASELDIHIDMDQIYTTPDAYYIINGQVAQIDFTTTNVNGDETELCLRATKDETLAADPVQSLAGIYDTDMSEANTIESGDTTFTVQTANTLQTTIYSWQVGDTYFTFTIGEGMSQMAIAELMDQMAAATAQ